MIVSAHLFALRRCGTARGGGPPRRPGRATRRRLCWLYPGILSLVEEGRGPLVAARCCPRRVARPFVASAEYETLVGLPGRATQGANVLNVGHLVVIVAILFGYVIYFAGRGRRGRARM